MTPILLQSDKQFWETPQILFELLDSIFNFSLDAASNEANHKCKRYLTEQDDALTTNWFEFMKGASTNTVFLNPPFGRGSSLHKWMKKVKEEADKGLTVVTLTAARTDTKFFRIIEDHARYLGLFYGRLKYELAGKPILDKHGRPVGATFPSALGVFSQQDWDLTKLQAIAKVFKIDNAC